MTLTVTQDHPITATRQATYHFLLVVNNNNSIWHCFGFSVRDCL